MKKLFFGATVVLGLLNSCTKEANEVASVNETENATAKSATSRLCPSEEMRTELLNSNPSAYARYINIEAQTNKYIQDRKVGKVLADGTVEIPVIFNVIYKTTAQNVSDARLQSQIDVLNKDYSATNTDISKIPAEFAPVAAGDVKVRFRLVKVNRKSSTKTSWSYTADAMKKASTGGIDATTPANYLNIWVVNYMPSANGDILGYATFPESAGLWNDGVVLAAPYVGTGTGTTSPFNLGRTATHEVGHYLNLRHIWGDGSGCATDYCDDTPVSPTATTGAPTYPLYGTCGGVKRSLMFMNYMDYSDDAYLYMFTANQKARMQATVATSGPRAGLRVL